MVHAILYGIFIGITFDCVMIVKNQLFNQIVKIALVALYWIVQLPLTFVYIYNVNEGIFHMYILIFLALGIVLYYKFMRQNLHHDLEMLGESLFTVTKFIKKMVIILVISPIMFIYKLVSDIIIVFLRILKLIFFTPFAKLGSWFKKKKKKVKVRRRGKKVKTDNETKSNS
jgi:spore cortex biosynthesis protein YabQ